LSTTREITGAGSEIQPRTGARILAALADPLNVLLLRALLRGPRQRRELRRECGAPAKGELRARLGELERLGVLVKEGRGALAGPPEYALAEPGRELKFVMIALERWLAASRGERFELDSGPAGEAIEALLEGWSSTVVRALAAGPLALAEVGEQSGALDRGALQRRLERMRALGMLETAHRRGRHAAYAVTDWLRRGAGAIVAASRWERRNLAQETAPIGSADAEGALLLTVPLMQLPPDAAGPCRLVVELPGELEVVSATVTAVTEDCRVTSYAPEPRDAEASANGPPSAWFRAAIEADPGHLALDGDRRLAGNLLDGLYAALYGLGTPARSAVPQRYRRIPK
jgi:DNA-binding HxlR family transcriptional regulator